MATPPRPIPLPRTTPWSRLRRRLGWAAVLLVAASAAFYWHPLTADARLAAAYGARQGCACRYIAGRPLGDCRKEFEPGMALVTLSEDAAARQVTARFALLFPQRATYRHGWGCQLEAWHD